MLRLISFFPLSAGALDFANERGVILSGIDDQRVKTAKAKDTSLMGKNLLDGAQTTESDNFQN